MVFNIHSDKNDKNSLNVPKGQVFRSRKSKKDKQYNAQNKKDKGTHDDLQNTTQETKDFALHEHHKKPGAPENRNKLKYQYITSHIFQYK